MAHDWIIMQLDAMAAYAAQNGLSALREALHQARLTALLEIAACDGDGAGLPPRAPPPLTGRH